MRIPPAPAAVGETLLFSTLALMLWMPTSGVAQAAPPRSGGPPGGELHASNDHADATLPGVSEILASEEAVTSAPVVSNLSRWGLAGLVGLFLAGGTGRRAPERISAA